MKDLITKGLLLDFYGPLLTERQRYCMEQHYENDLSLGEIAEELAISRQAVHDNLSRACQILDDYEAKLQLVAQYEQKQVLLERLKEALGEELIAEKGLASLLDEL